MPYDDSDSEQRFSRQVGEKERRKLRAQRENKRSVWYGLGLFGMVGWSVVVPMLVGAGIGIWMDKKHPVHFSWTLNFLVTGLILGCLIAWNWVRKENKNIHKKEEPGNE
ncbi:MAG: AtpZ/AtpI family protein [Puia sp.]|nr:AtpZ/AtpI family protein [Puia sp.]